MFYFNFRMKCLPNFAIFASVGWMVIASQTSAQVTLGNLSQVYDGSPKMPDVATNLTGLPVDLVYRKITTPPPPVTEVVFNNVPATLASSYSSFSPVNNQSSGLGNYLKLAKNARNLESVEVTLVTWAKAASYPAWQAANPQGYNHVARLSLYRMTETKQLVFLTEVEQAIFVPWRPLTLPNGSPYTLNGFAFTVSFAFPLGTTLPEKVLALVSYNTQSTGFAPLGVAGPYNELNVALGSSATPTTVGGDADPGAVLKVLYSPTVPVGVWEYPNTSLSMTNIPLIRLKAVSSQSKLPPVDAGNYEVSASVSDSSYAGGVLGVMSIDKAVATIQLGGLNQFYNGANRPVSFATTPPGLPVSLDYAGSGVAPTAIGTYDVAAQVTDPNYSGVANSRLIVSPSFQSWTEEKVSAGLIAADKAGDQDDPDADGVPNLVEYALGGLPESSASAPQPAFSLVSDRLKLEFIRSRADLTYVVEGSSDVGEWRVLAMNPGNVGESVSVSDTGADGATCRFLRLGVHR
jgi:hypothetical protein